MKRYRVTLTRSIEEYASVEVEAESPYDAKFAAYDYAGEVDCQHNDTRSEKVECIDEISDEN